MKTINGYQLHDSESEEILGSVYIASDNKGSEDELCEGWERFNKYNESPKKERDVPAFIEWFNENYVTQIGEINLNFIQP